MTSIPPVIVEIMHQMNPNLPSRRADRQSSRTTCCPSYPGFQSHHLISDDLIFRAGIFSDSSSEGKGLCPKRINNAGTRSSPRNDTYTSETTSANASPIAEGFIRGHRSLALFRGPKRPKIGLSCPTPNLRLDRLAMVTRF